MHLSGRHAKLDCHGKHALSHGASCSDADVGCGTVPFAANGITRRAALLCFAACVTQTPALGKAAEELDGMATELLQQCKPLPADRRVLDAKSYLSSDELFRLERILKKLEDDTGYRVRVVTQDRASAPCLSRTLSGWDVAQGANSASVAADAVVLVVDRGIPGYLESGGSLLKFLVGRDVQLALPPVFWSRLRREYGGNSYIGAKGIAASIVVSCEVILTCLRNEEFCVDVPKASASFF